jgi:heme/copper-type cytochrome/quinol oxidase subunit 3
MSAASHFARPGTEIDVSGLKTFAFGARSPMFWATALLCCIEGTALALLFISYFYLRENFAVWPPSARLPPIGGSITSAVLVASLLPMWQAGRAAKTLDRKRTMHWQVISTLVGAVGLALRAWEFHALPFEWTENAYASVVWSALGFHTLDFVAEMGEMVVLSAILLRGPLEDKHFEDVQVNAFFWGFLVLAWLPFAAVFYIDGAIR